MAQNEPPRQDLHCLQIQLFTSLLLKELTLKAPIKTAADDSLEFFKKFFSEKIRLDILCESSARQKIHMKHQALFSWNGKCKKRKKNMKGSSAAILPGSSRVKTTLCHSQHFKSQNKYT